MGLTIKQLLSENNDVIFKYKKLYCHSCKISIDCQTKLATPKFYQLANT